VEAEATAEPSAAASSAARSAAPAPGANEGALEAQAKKLPPVPMAPAEQRLGSAVIRAEVCTYEGETFLSKQPVTETAIGGLAWGSDGKLYAIDHTQAIRRYAIDASGGCRLTLDRSFGKEGLLRLEKPPGKSRAPTLTAGALAADASGHVFVTPDAVWTDGSWRLSGGKVDYYCPSSQGDVSVTADGKLGFSIESKLQKTTFDDAGCTTAEWPAGPLAERPTNVFVAGDSVYVTQHNGKELWAFDHDGKPRGVELGDKDKSLSAPGNICSVGFVGAIDKGIVVVDYNCRQLVFFDRAGQSLGDSVSLSRLFGVSYPIIEGFTRVEGGVAFLSFTHERGEAPAKPENLHQGFIVRLSGL
jgi:hypothetical protein